MSRATNSSIRRYRHRKTLSQTKGFRLMRKNVFKRAKEALLKAGPYAYTHRRLRKRTNRQVWNIKINAAARQNDITYSELINLLKKSEIALDRKILAAIAESDPEAFTLIVTAAK